MVPTTVLLIEDDEEDCLLLKKLLGKIANARYKLDCEISYEAGLARMLRNEHDICMIDYRLGARNGIELLREAREQGYSRPIILLTGTDEFDIDIQALHAGADDYISKSQLQGELLHRIIRYAIERKKAEREREELLRKQIASEELERKRTEFISMVVHELKTPLAALKGFAQLLSRRLITDSNSQVSQIATRIDVQSNKLTALIDDLLDITRIESGSFQFYNDHFSFDRLVTETMEELQLMTETHRLVKEGVVKSVVWGDSKRIGQVIANFLMNAIKYAPDTDIISVRVAEDEQYVTLSVLDSGPGIQPGKQEKIFEPFYRLENMEKRTTPGLGLGLYISSEIIHGQCGEIWVESCEGKGSAFSFKLPIEQNQVGKENL